MERVKKRRAFSRDECHRICQMLMFGRSIREIGLELSRNHGTISKFLKRNKHPYPGVWRSMSFIEQGSYLYDKQKERRGRVIEKRGSRKSEKVWEYVVDKLVNYELSPELISGRIEVDCPGERISFQSIYNMIGRRGNEYLKPYLYEKGRKRRKNVMGRRSRFKEGMPQKENIRNRPKEASLRLEPGHLEIDCILSCRSGKGALVNIVDRYTRDCIGVYVDNLEAKTVRKEVVKIIHELPKGFVKTITLDNGTEFLDFFVLEKIFPGLKIYWCDPYKPQQRGTVERSNRNFRKFFPKGTDFSKISKDRLQKVTNIIRDTPLKLHQFRTPKEVLMDYEAEHKKAA